MVGTAGKTVRPYGAWESVFSTERITQSYVRMFHAQATLVWPYVYWVEGRPEEKGRQVLCRAHVDGSAKFEDVTPGVDSGFNVRTRVHEYGGGDYVVHTEPNGTVRVFFSNFADQALYEQVHNGNGWSAPRLVTDNRGMDLRFADMVVDAARNRLITVMESHSPQLGEPRNCIAAVALSDSGEGKPSVPEVLVEGHDFFGAPRVSPDGRRLAWIAWDHPNMPWDTTALYLAPLTDDGCVAAGSAVVVAGGAGSEESVLEPTWHPDGSLYFVSDRDQGWWGIFKVADGMKIDRVCVQPNREYGGPHWMFRQQFFDITADGTLVCAYADVSSPETTVVIFPPGAKETRVTLPPKVTIVKTVSAYKANDKVYIASLLGGSALPEQVGVLTCDADGSTAYTELRASLSGDLPSLKDFSIPETIEYPTEGGRTAFMLYYPPANAKFEAPAGERPPLIVKIHGGPTAAASPMFNLWVQFWTNRGFALCDVNYGGSTGFGREYRNRLRGQWGVVDVQDCSNAARYLGEKGLVDSQRLCITGGSAGGFTVLACLAFTDVFAAGASHYGVGDLMMLTRDTHKFESRYPDQLLGPLPEAKALYESRSPINHVEKITCPLVLFQGDEDEVVPPNQAEAMYKSVVDAGVKASLVMFEGEQHGFRKTPNIRRALDGELYFLGKVLGFDPALPADFVPLDIANLN